MTDIVARTLSLEKLRLEALLSGDAAKLSPLIDEHLVYTHSSGRRDDRAAYLDSVTSGRTKYLSIDPYELSARTAGEVVILEGTARLSVISSGIQKNMHNRFTAVWTTSGGSPKLTAYASTPVQASV